MKNSLAVLMATLFLAATTALATNYSTEATITKRNSKGEYLCEVRICELVEHDGKQTERVLNKAQIVTAPGVPAELYVGPGRSKPEFKTDENTTVNFSWPAGGESFALCTVTIRRGDTVISKSQAKVQVAGK